MAGAITIEDAMRPTIDPGWALAHTGHEALLDGSRQSRFAISNGFLGVPGARIVNPGVGDAAQACTYVAGLFDTPGAGQPLSGLVPAPDWMRVGLSVRCGAAADADGETFHGRTLDMRRGVLLTHGVLSHAPGVRLDMRVLRLVSLAVRTTGLQLVRAEVLAGDADVTLEASFIEPGCGLIAEDRAKDFGTWRTTASGKRLAIAACVSLSIDGDILQPSACGPLRWSWTWRAHPGQVVCLARTVAILRGQASDTGLGARTHDALRVAEALGWRGVLAQHEAAWARRWDNSDIIVEGDAQAQQALRFALYHLNGAANPGDEHVSIAARALTGPDYFGHVFWDTEIFLLPFYTLTWPEAARALLMYRFHTLDAARAKARRLGFAGALYAWESADTGSECTPEHAVGPDRKIVDILCGTQEQHISADVAYAVWHYWHATGDDAFLRAAGAEILLETARFWVSRAQPEADGVRHIRGVIGPDEYHEHVDDNAYTNVMARWTILRALDVAALLRARWPDDWLRLSPDLDDAELARWAAAAAAVATGLDRDTGVFEQFAGYFALEPIDLAAYAGRSVPMDVVLGRERTARSQVVKQADVVALLALLPEAFAGASGAANFAYYEPRCSHGSSLSRAMHGLVAARLGNTEQALQFFRDTSAIDLADTHAALDGGVHIAALGGIWMIAVLGFAGVSLRDDGVAIDPQLPSEWTRVAFSLAWRGRRIGVAIDPAASRVEASLIAGDPMLLTVGTNRQPLSAAAPVCMSYCRHADR